MNKGVRIILVISLFLLLFAIRAFAVNIFYDPLITYFKNDYLYLSIPEIDTWRLITGMFFRYIMNSLISLAIIWLIFKRKEWIRFSSFFFMVAFMVMIMVFAILLRGEFDKGYLFPFYVRRFIIHPVFLLILLPAFYYQKLSEK